MHRLMTGIHSEKCTGRQFRRRVIEATCATQTAQPSTHLAYVVQTIPPRLNLLY